MATALRKVSTLVRRRGLIVLASDLYDEEVTLAEIKRLARMGHDVVTLHVIAREESTLPRGGATEFVDLETEATLVASADAIADEYSAAFASFLLRSRQSIEREGLDYVRLITGEPLEPVLRRFLIGRRGASTSRALPRTGRGVA